MSFNRISESKLAALSEKYFSVDSKIDINNVTYYFRPGGLNIIINGEKPEEIPICTEFMDEITEIWSEYRGKAVEM